MIANTNTPLTLLNVGIAHHQADWNWHNVRSPFARIYYVVEGHAQILLPDKKLELTAGRQSSKLSVKYVFHISSLLQ